MGGGAGRPAQRKYRKKRDNAARYARAPPGTTRRQLRAHFGTRGSERHLRTSETGRPPIDPQDTGLRLRLPLLKAVARAQGTARGTMRLRGHWREVAPVFWACAVVAAVARALPASGWAARLVPGPLRQQPRDGPHEEVHGGGSVDDHHVAHALDVVLLVDPRDPLGPIQRRLGTRSQGDDADAGDCVGSLCVPDKST